jgi:hypothetical protein
LLEQVGTYKAEENQTRTRHESGVLAIAYHIANAALCSATRGPKDELDQREEGEEACGEQRAERME